MGKETIHITIHGLLAGEQYLREHSEEFDDGTKDGFHSYFIHTLVSEVLRASCIDFEMPPDLH
jgi:hypothetical protein